MLLERSRHLHRLEGLLTRHPIVGLLGARQVGTTTLARQLVARSSGPTTAIVVCCIPCLTCRRTMTWKAILKSVHHGRDLWSTRSLRTSQPALRSASFGPRMAVRNLTS